MCWSRYPRLVCRAAHAVGMECMHHLEQIYVQQVDRVSVTATLVNTKTSRLAGTSLALDGEQELQASVKATSDNLAIAMLSLDT